MLTTVDRKMSQLKAQFQANSSCDYSSVITDSKWNRKTCADIIIFTFYSALNAILIATI